jgi:hypothetical protein
MARTSTSAKDKRSMHARQVFRYWVELRDLENGSTRNLPLTAIAKIHIPRKRNEAQRPSEEILQLHDNSVIIEAKNLDELAAQLRQKYPDEAYERTLHRERDHEAEQRRADAMNSLIEILAKSVAEQLLREGQGC